jgi:multiple sugar transport system substrate-binding protein
MAAEASFLMYNKNLFRRAGLDPEKPPTNFAEFEDIAVKISEIGDEYYGYFVSTAGGGNCSFTFTPLIWATGGNILNDDGSKVTMTDPAVKEALAFYRRLFRRGAMPETCQSDAGANRIPIFASGRIGIIPGGTFNAAFIIKNHPEIELGTTPIPGKNGGIGTFSGGDNFVIPKGTKKLAVAKEFIEWVYTLEGQTILAEYGSLPPRLDIAAEALKDKHPLYQMAARLLEIGQTPYNDRYMELFNSNNSPWVEMIQRATFTDESIDVITRETEEFIQNVIDQD